MRLGRARGGGRADAVAVCGRAAPTAAMTAEPIAVLQGLDKITARVSRFEAPVGQR